MDTIRKNKDNYFIRLGLNFMKKDYTNEFILERIEEKSMIGILYTKNIIALIIETGVEIVLNTLEKINIAYTAVQEEMKGILNHLLMYKGVFTDQSR